MVSRPQLVVRVEDLKDGSSCLQCHMSVRLGFVLAAKVAMNIDIYATGVGWRRWIH